MVEGARLEILCTPRGYRGFKSHPFRQFWAGADAPAFFCAAVLFASFGGTVGRILPCMPDAGAGITFLPGPHKRKPNEKT